MTKTNKQWPSPLALDRELSKHRRATGVLRRNNGRGTVSRCCLGVYQEMCHKRGLKLRGETDGVGTSTTLNLEDLPDGHWMFFNLVTREQNRSGIQNMSSRLMSANDGIEKTKGTWGLPQKHRELPIGSAGVRYLLHTCHEALKE